MTVNNYLDNITNIKEILANILQLQNDEKNQYVKLSKVSPKERSEIIDNISQLTLDRIAAHENLEKIYNDLKKTNFDLTKETAEMLYISQITENELDNKKKYLEKLNSDKLNKKRLIQLNMYYTTKYRAWNKVMKLIIMICMPLLIISILKKKEIISQTLSLYLLYSIFVSGGIYIIYRIVDLLIRDNLIFDEYYMPMNVKKDDLDFNSYQEENNNSINLQSNIGYCIGNSCCSSGTIYDYEKHLCKIPEQN